MTEEGNTLLALAERCEAATGADRELDADIARALAVIPQNAKFEKGSTFVWAGACGYDLAAYTTSIDAAMSLVPEGWWLAGLNYCPQDFRSAQDKEWHAEFAGPITWAVVDREIGEEPHFECEGGNAATPALALCAAALRARATKESDQ